ncbi:TetR/AcrR family transcriptional regulator [Galbitalea sp. SE-J8]|uniref:TetR/AcrR family transcriptional regulator n=1 Tax=Galbitalea sp. SE-J8 TaxID=3054952 RepID=UPI00259D294A|nr:TetR/AcrR family transcriptional regulator [Galbitalea sp. SE-J8]MDM4761986.1 TetR/AcrR family transcriptional regulator [Galbitalea sp. SE-J8]
MSTRDADPAPRSRRERPAKAALTREGIIEVALAILERDGLSKVTMRRIAAELDTGAASLYVYVRNTEDLHAQILDALLGGMAPVPTGGSWRERLHRLLAEYGTVLVAHPQIARLTMTTHPVGANYFRLVETILGLLGEGGVPDRSAAWGVDLLLASVTATAVEHGGAADSEGTDALSLLAANIAITPGGAYPRIVALGDEMLSGTGIERFAWGIDVLLNGLLDTPRSATGERS